jgi:hypothetical protein
VAVVTMHRGFYPSGAAFEFMPAVAGAFIRMTRLSATQPDLIDRLNEFRPNSLVAYPSVLDWLAVQSSPMRLAPYLRQVGSTGEHLTDRARQRITQAFGVPVFDHYGIGECLFLADGCPTDGGSHVNADWAILEVVDKDYRPVPAGQPGAKILVTNLANTVQPIIRYEVGDVVTLAERPCRCGSRLPWIERIDGRERVLGRWMQGRTSGPFSFDFGSELTRQQIYEAVLHQPFNLDAPSGKTRRAEIIAWLRPAMRAPQVPPALIQHYGRLLDWYARTHPDEAEPLIQELIASVNPELHEAGVGLLPANLGNRNPLMLPEEPVSQ